MYYCGDGGGDDADDINSLETLVNKTCKQLMAWFNRTSLNEYAYESMLYFIHKHVKKNLCTCVMSNDNVVEHVDSVIVRECDIEYLKRLLYDTFDLFIASDRQLRHLCYTFVACPG